MMNRTVFVCVFDKTTKQVLLVLNKHKKSIGKPGKWGLPGGGVEERDRAIENGLDQTITNAVYRELEEETGLFREFVEIKSKISRDAILVEHVVDRSVDRSNRSNKGFHQVVVLYAETKISAAELPVAPAQTCDVGKAEWVPVNKLYDLLKQKKLYYSHYRRIMFFTNHVLKRFS